MNKNKILRSLLWASPALILCLSFNACDPRHDGINDSTSASKITVTGNPFTTQKILVAVCEIITKAHTSLTTADCLEGANLTSFSRELGVPENILNPYRTLVDAESDGKLVASQMELESCLSAIERLSPQSAAAQSAYNAQSFNPYAKVMNMIPTSACAKVFAGNKFDPNLPVIPQPNTAVVNFDTPTLGEYTTANLIDGVYNGIDFGKGNWTWDMPFDANTTRFAYNFASTTGDTHFSFSGGAKKLISLNVFSPKSDLLVRIYDDHGQSFTQNIPADHQMHLLQVNFQNPSNHIFIHTEGVASRYGVGIDDITYELPNIKPTIAQIQSYYAFWDRTNSMAAASFNSANTAGNLIVAQVEWRRGSLTSLSDSRGNTYTKVGDPILTPDGKRTQIWYAKNIAAGNNKITARFSGANELSDLFIHEYAGLDTNNPLGTVSNSGSLVVSSNNELIFAAIVQGQINSFGTDWAVRRMDDYRISPSADRAHAASGLLDASWALQLISFKGK